MTEIQFTSEITVRKVQQCGGDHMIVAAAKVSTSGEEALKYAVPICPLHPPDSPDFGECIDNETVKANYGLIRYLMKSRHGSPFEHGLLTVFVHAPIFVWREYHRHRIGHSFSEESARYKTLEPVFYLPPKDRPMFKVDDWKPGRPKFLPIINQVGEAAYDRLCKNLKESYEKAYRAYEQNLGLGIDPGLARDCLPVGIYSSCWVTVNPRSLMAFLSLRTHDMEAKYPSYPLYEIEVAARKLEVIFAEHWPLVHKAFCECGRVAP